MWQRVLKYGRMAFPIVAIGFLIYFFFSLFLYIVLSWLITLILRPLFDAICQVRIYHWRPPFWLASLLSLGALYLIIGLLIALFVPQIIEEIQRLSDMDPRAIAENYEPYLQSLARGLERYGIEFQPDQFVQNYLQEKIQELLDFGYLGQTLNSLINLTTQIAIGIFSVSFISFFFLKERRIFPTILLFLTPRSYNRSLVRVMYKSNYLLRRYFIGILGQITVVALIVSIGLALFGFKSALLIGFFAGVINVIPYLGPVLGFLFATFLGLTTHLTADPATLGLIILKIFIVFGIYQVIDNILLQPLIHGSSVKAHPLEIFVVILMAAQIGGIMAMVAAIPCYTVIRVIASEYLRNNAAVQELTKRL
jgi:predicted PurR-regulated permease PerM